MNSHGEGNGDNPVAKREANVQSLQSVGGNEGKSLITPGNNSTIPELFLGWGQRRAASGATWWQAGRQVFSHTNQSESMEPILFIY